MENQETTGLLQIEKLSIFIYQIFETIGVTEHCRKLYQKISRKAEQDSLVNNHLYGIHRQAYCFGSYSEGSVTPGLGSDIDIVYINKDWTVYTENSVPPKDKILVMFSENHATPGYVKLQVNLNEPCDVIDKFLVEKDVFGRDLLTNQIKNQFSSGNRYLKNTYEHVRSGPAVSYITIGDTEMDYDTVFGYKCQSWPPVAEEWLNRTRHSNWPSSETLSSLQQLGCFLVPTGPAKSSEKHLQWRISFSKQEQHLMCRLSDIQHKCYVLLKLVKKDLICEKLGKCVTSYHCKTSLFFTIENTDSEFWTKENILSGFLKCLQLLLQWTKKGFCPNYFIPGENLFLGKIEGTLRSSVAEILQKIIINPYECLKRLTTDKVGRMLELLYTKDLNQEYTDLVSKAETTHAVTLLSLLFEEIKYWVRFRDILFSFIADSSSIKMAVQRHFSCIEMLHLLETDYEQSADTMTQIPVILFLLTSLASHLVVLALQCEDIILRDWYLAYASYCFLVGKKSDALSGELKYATALYALGHVESACVVIDQLQFALDDQDLFPFCICRSIDLMHVNKKLLLFINNYRIKKQSIHDVSAMEFLYKHVYTCVVFLPEERVIMPYLLQYEPFRSSGIISTDILRSRVQDQSYFYDWAVMDSNTYLCYITFLVNKTKKTLSDLPITHLSRIIKTEKSLCHRETAATVCGWIAREMGYDREAAAWYCYSMFCLKDLETAPFKLPFLYHYNAAKWHLLIFMYQQWKKQNKEH